MTTPLPSESWSVNRQAARAIAGRKDIPVATGNPDNPGRLDLLEMLGLIDEDRNITPDDTRVIELSPLIDPPVERSQLNVREPSLDRDLIPPGLRNLPPVKKATNAGKPRPRAQNRGRCGTITGASMHQRMGEPTCRACKDVRNEYARQRRARLRAGNPTPPPTPTARINGELPERPDKCGTVAGRSYHMRRGDKVCRQCLDAYNDHQRQKRLNRAASRDAA